MKQYLVTIAVIFSLGVAGCTDPVSMDNESSSISPENSSVKAEAVLTDQANRSAIGKVNWDNYVVAETDWYFNGVQQKAGVNAWMHDDPVSKDNQQVIRSNRDVVYSIAIVDVSEGATFSVPAAGPENDAFQVIQIIDENHLFHKVVRRGETVTVHASDLTGGTHVYLLARTKDNGDYKDTKRRQAGLKFTARSNKPYKSKGFDEKDVIAYREQLVRNVMTGKAGDVSGKDGFGATLNDVKDNDYKHAAAVGWGGLPADVAQYLPAINGQGKTTCQKWTVPNPNLDYKKRGGYWSITTYSAAGWIVTDKFYLSAEDMQDNGDGTSTAYFNCPDVANSLKVEKGWTAIVRFYEPVDVQESLDYLNKLAAIPLVSVSAESTSGISDIDSSQWKADPVKYGMTAKEYIQAESRAFIANFIGRSGINQWFHFQALANKDDKWVVSPNNDTIYSMAAVNVSDGFTLVIPDVGKRFVSIQIVDENHISPFYLYGGGAYKFTRDQFESDYVAIGIRMGTDGTPEDVKHIVEDLQPQYKILDANPEDKMVRPDTEKMLKVRKAMITRYDALPDTFGVMVDHTSKVKDWEKFTYVTAGAWGLSPDHTAMYAPYALDGVKGGMCYTATYPAVPASAFWSITVYGQDKFLMADHDNIVSSNQKAIVNNDGSFTIVFGGMDCKVKGKNFLYTPEDNWTFLMRAYRPDVEKFKNYSMPEIKGIN